MEEARRKLFEKVVRKFTLAEVAKHRSIGPGQRNIVELISKYPGYGRNFKIYRASWPEDSFIHINRVELFVSFTLTINKYIFQQSGRFGRMWGVKYWKGERQSTKVEPIKGLLKRGVW